MARAVIHRTVSKAALDKALTAVEALKQLPALSQQPDGAKLVVFLDMLGFQEVTNFSGFKHSKKPPKETMRYCGIKCLPWSGNYDSAGDVYQAFQKIIRAEVRAAQRRRKAVAPLTTIIFSDAVYMVFTSATEIVKFTTTTMLKMMLADIPVRMGIGFGHVVRHNFTSETFPTNDIILSAPFMGHGIISAYRAERSPQKGLRIFVDGAASSVIKREGLQHYLLNVPGAEWPNCRHELNYLSENVYPLHASIVPFRLESMAKFSPKRAQRHYSETKKAIERMMTALKGSRKLRKPRRA